MYKVTTLSKRNSTNTFYFFSKKDAARFVEGCNISGIKTVENNWRERVNG